MEHHFPMDNFRPRKEIAKNIDVKHKKYSTLLLYYYRSLEIIDQNTLILSIELY